MRTHIALLLTVLFMPMASAQVSDFELKQNFELRYDRLHIAIETAQTTRELDSLSTSITGLEQAFGDRSTFLDKALYPESFRSKLNRLRTLRSLTYDRVAAAESRQSALQAYELRIGILTSRLDSITKVQRTLMEDLRTGRESQRDAVKRLMASLQAKDRLIFALSESLFLPYDKNVTQADDAQREGISRKVLKSNIVARLYDIAADNVKFLEITQPQGKDYLGLIDHYHQFQSKWSGLKDKFDAAIAATDNASKAKETQGKKGQKEASVGAQEQTAHVDSAVSRWEQQLMRNFWSAIGREFSSKGVAISPFNDAEGFTTSIRSYVAAAVGDGRDVTVFVNEVWKERIDKEWRGALEKEGVLGKSLYAELDMAVSELGEKKIDTPFLLYAALFLAIVGLIWWAVGRKPTPPKPA